MAAGYGRRIRRGVVGTAVAAAAMAALTASQAPLDVASARSTDTVTPPPGPPIDGGSAYYTGLPPLNSPTAPAGGSGAAGAGAGSTRLPATVLDAYQRAQAAVAAGDPRCHLRWQLLAAIGQVESGQARGGQVDSEGTTITPILGPVLDGNGFAAISDTDHGAWDGDAAYDRAVGPMQFIPSTWDVWGADGNGDGQRDPNNVYDAALAAAHYLCADGRDLSDPVDLDRAILGYNHSQDYLALVKSWYEHFLNGGAVGVPDRVGSGPWSGGAAAASGGSTGAGGTGPAGSASPSASESSSASPSPSTSTSPSRTGTPSGPSPTWTATPPSLSPSPTWTATPPSLSPTPTATATTCPSGTASETASATPAPTATASPSGTATGTPCATASPTGSGTGVPSGAGPVAESASGIVR